MSPLAETIVGQPMAVELAQRWLAKKTTHPLLFYGPDGVGKRTLALEMAKVLNKESRKIDAGIHPDVRVVNLAHQAELRKEPIEKQISLRIETVLEERRRLLQTAVEGAWKVMILDEAHRLTPDAANVLLKILEEPPDHTALFLLTPYRDRLFQTILSRCQPVRFGALDNKEMIEVLKRCGVPEENRARLIDLALGSPGRALHISRDEELQAAAEAEDLWENVPRMTPAKILGKTEGRGKASRPGRCEIDQKLRYLLTPAIRAFRGGDAASRHIIQQIEAALAQLRQNVQPALVYENLLLQLSKERSSPPSATIGGPSLGSPAYYRGE